MTSDSHKAEAMGVLLLLLLLRARVFPFATDSSALPPPPSPIRPRRAAMRVRQTKTKQKKAATPVPAPPPGPHLLVPPRGPGCNRLQRDGRDAGVPIAEGEGDSKDGSEREAADDGTGRGTVARRMTVPT